MAMSMPMAMFSSHLREASPLPNLSSKHVYASSSLSASSCFEFRTKAPMNFSCRFQSAAVCDDLPPVGEDLPVDYERRTPKKDPKSQRRAGVLLHPTSLRGPHGIGDIGEEAIRFLDWLHSAGCSVWQVCIRLVGKKRAEKGKKKKTRFLNFGCLLTKCVKRRKRNKNLGRRSKQSS